MIPPVCAVRQGTSKEYIGEDTEEIKKAVKHALQQCCQQLRAHLVRRNALRDQRERKKVLTKVSVSSDMSTCISFYRRQKMRVVCVR